jgi:hypothetical protein
MAEFCAYCQQWFGKGPKGKECETSHGICLDCLIVISPKSPMAQRHIKAMRKAVLRTAEAGHDEHVKMSKIW